MPKSVGKSKLNHNDKIRQALAQANKLLQDGNLPAAEQKYQSILKRQPGHVETLQHLAIMKLQAGNSTSALHFMQKALASAPNDPQILKNIAGVYFSQGELEKASAYAEKAISHEADNIDALAISGAVFYQQGQPDKAIEQFGKALKLNPQDIFARHDMARALCSIGKYEEAINHFQLALSRNPNFDECRFNLANMLIELKNYDAALSHYQHLLEDQPGNPGILLRLGSAYELAGRPDKAVLSYESALQNDPNMIEARLNLGQIYLTTDPERSQGWFLSVLKIDPDHIHAHYWLGVQAQTMGNFEQATVSFEQAIKLEPEFSNAWYRLSINRNYLPGDQSIKKIEQQFSTIADTRADNPELITLGFTLGRFFEQQGDFDNAFRYFKAANQIKSGLYLFDKSQHDAQITDVINSFDSEFFRLRRDWGNSSRLPVFIVGMPRSGTTLVEQILAVHPSTHGAGEPLFMQELVTSLKTTNPARAVSHAGHFRDLDRQQIDQMAQQQLEKMQALQPSANRILDKLPGNYLRLGIIFTLFPEARIIHCKRDPMDTCWSCYQQNFEQGLAFTHDLDNLGHAYLGYLKLMAHWQELFPDRILDIEYEELLEDPETESRRLLHHCALDWAPDVLDFAGQEHPVATASLWQVRQPLYKTAIGRWKNYQKFLGPLEQILSTEL